jgi:hypothetical protein
VEADLVTGVSVCPSATGTPYGVQEGWVLSVSVKIGNRRKQVLSPRYLRKEDVERDADKIRNWAGLAGKRKE